MKALHRLLRLLTVLPILISAVVLPLLPERIPAHYNLAGEINRWGSRLEIFILPVFCLVSGFLWERTLHKLVASDPRNHKPMLIGGCCVQATFFGLFVAMLLSSCSQFEMTAEPGKAISKILGVVLGLSLIPIGNILPKVKRNGVFGLRTKWSMANDTCWNLCQRAGGLGLALTGILIVISSLLISSPILQSIAMLILIVGDSIASVILSYQIWKKHGKPPCA